MKTITYKDLKNCQLLLDAKSIEPILYFACVNERLPTSQKEIIECIKNFIKSEKGAKQ